MKKDPQTPPFVTLLWSFALVCILMPAYAQYTIKSECATEASIDASSEIYNDAPMRSCIKSRWAKRLRYTNFHYIEQELNKLQNSAHRLRILKRKIRRAKRVLKRHEGRLMAEINDIEEYIKVDERLNQPEKMEYYRSINLLTSRLLLNRAKQRKIRRLERKAQRLISRNSYTNSYRCGSYSSYHKKRRHHHKSETSPWMLAFMGLFGVNLLIGGFIAYKTLIK